MSFLRAVFSQYLRLIIILPILCISGCSVIDEFFGSEPPVIETAEEEPTPIIEQESDPKEIIPLETPTPAPTASPKSGISIIWKVPEERVSLYHISYSTNEEPSERITVPVQKLIRERHPIFGEVYRYDLKNIASDKNVHIEIQAENRFGISDPSEPVIVPSQE